MLLFEDFGESLSKIMSSSSETLTAEDNDQCAEDLLRAITALHQQGIYHLALLDEHEQHQQLHPWITDATGAAHLDVCPELVHGLSSRCSLG
eukprot:g17087.t1